jgi:endonuclease/exonuclease/phosphatase family metal-dependent hydrolase
VNLRLVTWNLFHGRDNSPRRFRIVKSGERYAQFSGVLRRLEWDIALLQEAPPRWHEALVGDLGASGGCALTSRNSVAWLRGLIADRAPDLIASNEGGSNQTFARSGWSIAESRMYTLTGRPERRRMLWTRLRADGGEEVAVANLHASVRNVPARSDEVLAAAGRAVEWAGNLPLVFGGDLNHSPAREPHVFAQLDARFGLAPPTPGDAIDHLLMRGLEVVDAPHKLPDSAREAESDGGLLMRLSDHACVAAVAGMK